MTRPRKAEASRLFPPRSIRARVRRFIRDHRLLLPGEGVVDLKGFYQALKKIGYADGLSPELLCPGLGSARRPLRRVGSRGRRVLSGSGV